MQLSSLIRKAVGFLPVKISNSLLARVINKVKWSYDNRFFKDVPLKYSPNTVMNLCCTDVGHRYIAFTGVYEDSLSKKIYKIARTEGGVMIDVGANYGYYSLIWAQFKNNKSYAFEASPRNYEQFSNNIKLNNLKDRIISNQIALSNQIGELTFDLGPNDQTGWGGLNHLKKDTSHNSTIVIVKSDTLSAFVNNNHIKEITVLKIDTEGSDVLVLEGALDIIEKIKVQHIFFEENISRMKELGLSSNQMIDKLTSLGYTVNKLASNEYYAFKEA